MTFILKLSIPENKIWYRGNDENTFYVYLAYRPCSKLYSWILAKCYRFMWFCRSFERRWSNDVHKNNDRIFPKYLLHTR